MKITADMDASCVGAELVYANEFKDVSPRVTVRMITYGHEKFIVKAVSSLLEDESYSDYELLISDDASPDGTKDVLLSYLKNYKGPIQVAYFRQLENRFKNPKLGCGHRAVFETFARGDLCLSMDGDDFSKPGRIKRTVELWDSLDPKPSIMIVNADVYLDKEGRFSSSLAQNGSLFPPIGERRFYPPSDIFTAQYPAFGTGTVSSSEFNSWCMKFPQSDGIIAGDAVHSRRAMMHKGIWFVNEPLFYYRVNEGSVSSRGISGKNWIHDRLLRWRLAEKDMRFLSPDGKLPFSLWIRFKYWILRTRMAEYLVDCPHWIWPFAVIPYAFISWRAAIYALKLRMKLIILGDVNASFKKR